MKYYLIDNPITPDPNDMRAVTVHNKTYTMNDILEMIDYRKVGLSRSQIEAVLREYGAALAFILTQGDKILTPLFNITPTVSGVFTDRHDRFDRNRHGINLKAKAGVEIQKVADLIVPEKITGNKPAPLIDSFFDKGSQTTDERLTPGKMARMNGLNLKFDETDPQQGIFLIQRDTKKETQVPVGDVLDNTGGTLTFQVPDKLPKGTYTVEVRSTMKGKTLRTGQYQDILAVV